MACDESTAATDAIALALTGPRKVSGDAGSVEQHSLADLIKAEQYLAGKCAATSRNRGIRFTKLVPEGA